MAILLGRWSFRARATCRFVPIPSLILLCMGPLAGAGAQEPDRVAALVGKVTEARAGTPIPGAEVLVEGLGRRAVTGQDGRYRLEGIPQGTRTLIVRRIGYLPVRITVAVPSTGVLTRDVVLAASALELPEITITAEPAARARGELATASVIDRDAVANQTASSLAGVLELVPGQPLQPPGLGNVQQFAIRTIPTTTDVSLTAGGPSTTDVAAFGTAIILDGVPVSNNANLQSLGPRGELSSQLSTTGGAGVDLRSIPAATIERVEVIRGIPSARFGDLTAGVVVVDTRAGVVPPAVLARFDPATLEGSFVWGSAVGGQHVLTVNADVAHTQIQPGVLDDDVWRAAGQMAYGVSLGRSAAGRGRPVQIDARARFFSLNQNNPENPDIIPGQAATNHDWGMRLLGRAALGRDGDRRATLTVSFADTRRNSTAQSLKTRGTEPFTDRLTEGRQEGHYIEGFYLAKLALEGKEQAFYSRLEAEQPFQTAGLRQLLRLGIELRREWNTGAGYQFDIAYPPQTTFNGVQGFDRPRRFDALPPLATSALYADLAWRISLGPVGVAVQPGLRLDMLHEGSTWLSGARASDLQPRLYGEIAPFPALRLRGGWGLTAKTPALGRLYPSPQYFDVVNVNYFANDPAERLALITTFIRDPTNPDLGFTRGEKAEAGIEFAPQNTGLVLDVVAFDDRTTGGIAFLSQPTYVLRDRFALDNTVSGQPPVVLEPPIATDTMPILLDQPANVLAIKNRGIEATLALPEIRPARLTLSVLGALIRTTSFAEGPDFGRTFQPFQLDPTKPRAPYWDGVTRRSERALLTYRLIHHQPRLGLVITAVIEHTVRQWSEDVAATDTLAFAGYVTRSGTLVPVPPEDRGNPEYADLRVPRTGQFRSLEETPPDWFLSLQLSKTLPLNGELRFSAFNLLDRLGRIEPGAERTYPRLHFGVEVTLPLSGVLPVGFQEP